MYRFPHETRLRGGLLTLLAFGICPVWKLISTLLHCQRSLSPFQLVGKEDDGNGGADAGVRAGGAAGAGGADAGGADDGGAGGAGGAVEDGTCLEVEC